MKMRNKVSLLHITSDHTGKMEGMASISTPVSCNGRCAKNAQIPGSICEACYAARMMKMYPALESCLKENFKVLTKRLLEPEELPLLNYALFRIESFGDISNVIQAQNYLRLIKTNPHVHFGWWSKNCDILAKAISREGKPENVQIVRSSLMVNKPVRKGYWFVDSVFTVYDKKYAEQRGIEINCGKRKCLECRKCYMEGGEIRELKK